jgi:phage tail tape measure protein, TP901 family, core region
MRNSLELEVLLKAIDQVSRPFKSVQAANQSLSGDIRSTMQTLRDLNGQAAKIDGFRKSSAELALTGRTLKQARQETAALAIQLKNTQAPTDAQTQAMGSARKNAADLKVKYNELRLSVQRQRQELSQSGINTRKLSSDDLRLKNSINATTAQFGRQREELAKVSAQQTKFNAVKKRYQAGKELADKVTATGRAATGVATTSARASVKLLKPGYELSQKNAELQATLGVAKDSKEMTALRTQARELGDNSAVSAVGAASAQLSLARAGGSLPAIQAATPVVLNMSQANNRSVDENAGLLMDMKTAFQLPDSNVAHIGDVISMAMSKNAVGFDDLSAALTYAAPAAQNVGASIEETTAMVSALHDANISGSEAGIGSQKVLERLLTPDGKANDALNQLNVKTTNDKGEVLPVFTILKALQQSFQNNNVGAEQRTEYVKTIFGEDASPAATTLLTDASTGKLDQLAAMLKTSDGKTDALVSAVQDNLGGDMQKFQSAYAAVGTDLFDQQNSSLRGLVQTATGFVLQLDGWLQKNQAVSASLSFVATAGPMLMGVIGSIGLVAGQVISGINMIMLAAGVVGPIFTAAFSGIAAAIGAITLPVLAVGAAVVAGALLIRAYWEPISAFFSGVIEGVMAAFAPIGEMFTPLTSAFAGLGEKLSGVWQWFKDLIAPVQTTQDTLNSCRDVGVTFGQSLADALLLPLNAFNKLRGGIDWVLEKLGIINKESGALDETAAKANAATQNGSYSPPASAYPGSYQPAQPSFGRSIVDQSRSEINITVAGGDTASANQLGEKIRSELERWEQSKQTQKFSDARIDFGVYS